MEYYIHNQLTGLQEKAQTFEDAKVLQNRIKQEYYATIQGLFTITVMVENPDGSKTQSLCDENGNAVLFNAE